MKEKFALVLTLFMLSGFCSVELRVEKLKGSLEYPYRYMFTQEGYVCGGGGHVPVLSLPKHYKKTLTLSSKHDGEIHLSIPTYKIDYRGRDVPKFVNDDESMMLEGNIFSLVGNSNEKGIVNIGGKTLSVNIKGGDPFITARYIDNLGSFEIYRSIDMRETLEDGSSAPKVESHRVNGHTTVAIYLKSIKLDKGQKNSFFRLSDKITIFRDESRTMPVFEGVFSNIIQEGKLLSIYFENNVVRRELFGVIHSTLLNKDLFIDIQTSQATINGIYTFD